MGGCLHVIDFEPFRFSLRILGDICIRKTTPRLNNTGSRRLSISMIRGVITDTESLSATDLFFRGQICLTDTKMTDRTEKKLKILSLRSIQTDLRTDDR